MRKSTSRQNNKIWTVTTVLLLAFLPACEATSPPTLCNERNGVISVPPGYLQADPDLEAGFGLPAGGPLCPTLLLPATPAGEPPEGFIGQTLVNSSLDAASQTLLDIAVGVEMQAIGWQEDGQLYVSLSDEGSHMVARSIGVGEALDMVFSTVNRLHLTYTRDGDIFYRVADFGAHPADSPEEFVVRGENPTVLLDPYNYAVIVYELAGMLRFMDNKGPLWWPGELGPGHDFRFAHSGDSNIFDDFAVSPATVTYRTGDNQMVVAQWEATTRGYIVAPLRPVATFTEPAGSHLMGPAELDYHIGRRQSDGEGQIAVSWVSRMSAPSPPPIPEPPIFRPVNPLAPTAVVSPERVYEAFNAAAVSNRNSIHDGGLYQRFTVPAGSTVTVTAWGQGWSSELADPYTSINPTDLNLQVGLDPAGGTTPDNPTVVWSEAQNSLNVFSPFQVSATAAGETMTLFLRSRPGEPRAHNEAYWDGIAVSMGDLINGDMEAPFGPHMGNPDIVVPAGWTPYFVDGAAVAPQPDSYQVRAAWSEDAGARWHGPVTVAENLLPAAGRTGAIEGQAYPFLSPQTEPATVHFFYLFASGDPPPASTSIRFGRPYQMGCELASGHCGDGPGEPLFARPNVRPATTLLLAIEPIERLTAFVTWNSLQADNLSHDIYATNVILD